MNVVELDFKPNIVKSTSKCYYIKNKGGYWNQRRGPDMTENCWEANNCGKEPGSKGDCPTQRYIEFDGTNHGRGGGRYCWRVPGTLCDAHNGRPIPNWADKMKDCIHCDFFKKVREEEGEDFRI